MMMMMMMVSTSTVSWKVTPTFSVRWPSRWSWPWECLLKWVNVSWEVGRFDWLIDGWFQTWQFRLVIQRYKRMGEFDFLKGTKIRFGDSTPSVALFSRQKCFLTLSPHWKNQFFQNHFFRNLPNILHSSPQQSDIQNFYVFNLHNLSTQKSGLYSTSFAGTGEMT